MPCEQQGKHKSFNHLSCGIGENEEKEKKNGGEGAGSFAIGDHPSDSGTEMLLRDKGTRSVSLLVNLWRFSSQFLLGAKCV